MKGIEEKRAEIQYWQESIREALNGVRRMNGCIEDFRDSLRGIAERREEAERLILGIDESIREVSVVEDGEEEILSPAVRRSVIRDALQKKQAVCEVRNNLQVEQDVMERKLVDAERMKSEAISTTSSLIESVKSIVELLCESRARLV